MPDPTTPDVVDAQDPLHATREAAYDAPTTLFEVPLTVIRLTDGRKVIDATSVVALLTTLGLTSAEDQAALQAFQRWLTHLPPPPEGVG